jgi:hypothetical protein
MEMLTSRVWPGIADAEWSVMTYYRKYTTFRYGMPRVRSRLRLRVRGKELRELALEAAIAGQNTEIGASARLALLHELREEDLVE